ncbi:MAG TPA: FkbM family methyltransferase [Candidatus Limnocylindria bacterium]
MKPVTMSADVPEDLESSGPDHRVNELHLLLAVAGEFEGTGLFIDVGAHVGSYSEGFARRGWDVIAVEAAPEIHAELVDRLAPYERVDVVHAAATETGGGEIEFFISSEFWGIHSLRPFHETHDKSVMVPTVRIADLLDGRSRSVPLVIKVDTEGADLLVLRGIDWAAEQPRLVLCEFMDERTAPHFGYVYTDIIEFMEERGYIPYVSEWAPVAEPSRRGHGGGPFTHLQIVRAPLGHQPAWGNLFFVSPQDQPLFERVLHRYLIETRQRNDEVVAAAAKSVTRLSHLEQSIANRETTIDGLKGAVSRKDARIETLDSAITQRDARIAKLDEAIERKDARIATLDHELAERNDRFRKLVARKRRMDLRYRVAIGLLIAVSVVLAVVALTR